MIIEELRHPKCLIDWSLVVKADPGHGRQHLLKCEGPDFLNLVHLYRHARLVTFLEPCPRAPTIPLDISKSGTIGVYQPGTLFVMLDGKPTRGVKFFIPIRPVFRNYMCVNINFGDCLDG